MSLNLMHFPPDTSHLGARGVTAVSRGQLSNQPLRIILADDHPVVLSGIEMALSDRSFSVVAKAHNARELIEHLERIPCDLIISDYSMPDERFPDGLALMGYLKRHYRAYPLMVITMMRTPSILRTLLNAGVDGLFDKRSPLNNLKPAALNVVRGLRYICPAFTDILQAQSLRTPGPHSASVNLSDREWEVVRLFTQGLSGRKIAAQLNRSEKTISRQKRTAMDKLGLEHDGGLMEFARASGLGN